MCLGRECSTRWMMFSGCYHFQARSSLKAGAEHLAGVCQENQATDEEWQKRSSSQGGCNHSRLAGRLQPVLRPLRRSGIRRVEIYCSYDLLLSMKLDVLAQQFNSWRVTKFESVFSEMQKDCINKKCASQQTGRI